MLSSDWLTIEDLVAALKPLKPRQVRERVIHRDDFPKPFVLTRKARFWPRAEVDAWWAQRRPDVPVSTPLPRLTQEASHHAT